MAKIRSGSYVNMRKNKTKLLSKHFDGYYAKFKGLLKSYGFLSDNLYFI